MAYFHKSISYHIYPFHIFPSINLKLRISLIKQTIFSFYYYSKYYFLFIVRKEDYISYFYVNINYYIIYQNERININIKVTNIILLSNYKKKIVFRIIIK